jgi:hypothetical protein
MYWWNVELVAAVMILFTAAVMLLLTVVKWPSPVTTSIEDPCVPFIAHGLMRLCNHNYDAIRTAV